IYIAFAIDTTSSMQASIEAARAMASALVADASKRYRDVTLRLGLVEYRDAAPVFGYKVRKVTGFTDPAGLRAALDRIGAAKSGDGSIDEAVLDGITMALPPAPGEPISAGHLDWPTGRAGELATKLLVLLGDAPDHARNSERARALAERARRAGITIAAVFIPQPILSRDEHARYRDQWHTLAEGSFRPRDRESRFREPLPPIELELSRAAQLGPKLQALIDDRIQHARELAALAMAEAEGKLQEYADSRGLTLDQIAPVLVDLHRNESRPEPRPDPQFQGRKAPSLRRGWIAERLGGKRLVDVQILMARAELDLLIRELSQLQRAAQGTASDLADLLRIETAAAAGETAFLAADRADQTFADHLRRRQGLPP
ncbi:MAG: VWA domain-containing protein, partial [Isosphaeraceae bacterium]|nr:VWA domain-containing protein [Isosphaeraceae bacterium]